MIKNPFMFELVSFEFSFKGNDGLRKKGIGAKNCSGGWVRFECSRNRESHLGGSNKQESS